MTVIHLNQLTDVERTRKELEFDIRLRTLLLEMERVLGKNKATCLAASLNRLTKSHVFEDEISE